MSTTAVAYRLTDEHDLRTYGGTVHLRDGLALNIRDALLEGARPADAEPDWTPGENERGTLVTDDPVVIGTLDERIDLQRIQVPEGAKITSHQLQPTLAEQHERDKADVPEIAFETAAMSGAEIAAAQLRGDLPVPTVPPPDAYADQGLTPTVIGTDPQEIAVVPAPGAGEQQAPAGSEPGAGEQTSAAGGSEPGAGEQTSAAGGEPAAADPGTGAAQQRAPRTASERGSR